MKTKGRDSKKESLFGMTIWQHIWRAVFFILVIAFVFEILWAVNGVFETIVVSGLLMLFILLRTNCILSSVSLFDGVVKLYKQLKKIKKKLGIDLDASESEPISKDFLWRQGLLPGDSEDEYVFEKEINEHDKTFWRQFGEVQQARRLMIICYVICLYRILSAIFFRS